MKFFAVPAVLVLATPAFPQYTLMYDTFYDGNLNSLSSVTCSTGQYGLITYGYNAFGDLPTYPNIGGVSQIQNWNSHYCGTCWELTYTDPYGGSSSINFTAINTSGNGGFIISFAGMDVITNGNAERLDGVSITAVQIPMSVCGMSL